MNCTLKGRITSQSPIEHANFIEEMPAISNLDVPNRA